MSIHSREEVDALFADASTIASSHILAPSAYTAVIVAGGEGFQLGFVPDKHRPGEVAGTHNISGILIYNQDTGKMCGPYDCYCVDGAVSRIPD